MAHRIRHCGALFGQEQYVNSGTPTFKNLSWEDLATHRAQHLNCGLWIRRKVSHCSRSRCARETPGCTRGGGGLSHGHSRSSVAVSVRDARRWRQRMCGAALVRNGPAVYCRARHTPRLNWWVRAEPGHVRLLLSPSRLLSSRHIYLLLGLPSLPRPRRRMLGTATAVLCKLTAAVSATFLTCGWLYYFHGLRPAPITSGSHCLHVMPPVASCYIPVVVAAALVLLSEHPGRVYARHEQPSSCCCFTAVPVYVSCSSILPTFRTSAPAALYI